MLYAWQTTNRLVVGAADAVSELVEFNLRVGLDPDRPLGVERFLPVRLRPKTEFGDFIIAPTVLTFHTQEEALDFAEAKPITLLARHDLILLQIDIAKATAKAELDNIARPMTIGEKMGLPQTNTWKPNAGPTIVDETKHTDRPAGLTGDDSFAHGPDGSELTVEGIELRKDKNGIITVERIEGRFGGRSYAEHEAAIRTAERQVRETGRIKTRDFILFAVTVEPQGSIIHAVSKTRYLDRNDKATIHEQATLPDGFSHTDQPGVYRTQATPDQAIQTLVRHGWYHDPAVREVFDHDQTVQKRGLRLSSSLGKEFYRFDVAGASWDLLEASWTDKEWSYMNNAAGYGELDGLIWMAFTKAGVADIFRGRIAAAGHNVSELFAVNLMNQPLVQAKPGAVAKPTEAPILPRPWNELADALDAMTEAERQDNRQSYTSAEFVYARIHHGVPDREYRIAITPISFFRDHRVLWDQPLEIGDLLPSYLAEISPGIYGTRRSDWATLENEMSSRRGFQTHLLFQSYANEL